MEVEDEWRSECVFSIWALCKCLIFYWLWASSQLKLSFLVERPSLSFLLLLLKDATGPCFIVFPWRSGMTQTCDHVLTMAYSDFLMLSLSLFTCYPSDSVAWSTSYLMPIFALYHLSIHILVQAGWPQSENVFQTAENLRVLSGFESNLDGSWFHCSWLWI